MKVKNVATYLENAALAHPNKTALIFENRGQWTFEEVEENASALASALLDLGIEKGDVVTILLPSSPEFLFSYFGVLKTGATVNPLNIMLKQRELSYIFNDCQPKVIITTPEVLAQVESAIANSQLVDTKIVLVGSDGLGQRKDFEVFEELLKKHPKRFESVEVQKDDVGALLYTSGTTGVPKGVMLTHYNLWTNARHCADWAETTYKDVGVCALPMFHAYALSHVVGELWMESGTLVWHERFDAEKCLESMKKYKASTFHGVATMFYAMLNHDRIDDYASEIKLRYCVTGAAVTPVPILEAWNKRFTPMNEGYGLTEAGPVVTMNPLPGKGVQKPKSCGIPLVPEIEVMVFNSDDEPVKAGEVGELVVRGPNVMKGYLNKPEETAETLRNGWLHTGDLAYYDEDGYFYIVDRKKDMICRAGFNIYPKEVEDLIYTHPAVAEVQVVGVPDIVKGEEVVACIALKKGRKVTEQEIIDFCRANLAHYKAPKYVRFFDSLPKTATGKLEKVTLRKILEEEFCKEERNMK